jgi:hypothetical protein
MHNVEMAPGALLDTEEGPLSTRGDPMHRKYENLVWDVRR